MVSKIENVTLCPTPTSARDCEPCAQAPLRLDLLESLLFFSLTDAHFVAVVCVFVAHYYLSPPMSDPNPDVCYPCLVLFYRVSYI